MSVVSLISIANKKWGRNITAKAHTMWPYGQDVKIVYFVLFLSVRPKVRIAWRLAVGVLRMRFKIVFNQVATLKRRTACFGDQGQALA